MLGAYLQIILKRKLAILAFTGLVILGTFFILSHIRKTYVTSCMVRIVQLNTATSFLNQDGGLVDKLALVETHKFMLKSHDVLSHLLDRLPYLQASLLQSQGGMFGSKQAAVLSPQNMKWAREIAIFQLQYMINLVPVKFTDMLQVEVRYAEKKQVAEIANTLVTVYQEWLNEKGLNRYEETAVFLNQQLAAAKTKLTGYDTAVHNYMEENKLVSITDELKAKLDMFNQIKTKLVELETKSNYYQTIVNKIKGKPDLALEYVGLAENEAVRDLTKTYEQINYQLKVSSSYLQPKHPKYIGWLQQRIAVKQQLYQRLIDFFRAKILELEIGYKKETEELGKYQTELDLLNVKKQQLDSLEREYKTAETSYLNLLNKSQEIEVLKAKKSLIEIIVITPAVEPIKHAYPKRTKTMLVATLFGFMLALFTAIFYDKYKTLS